MADGDGTAPAAGEGAIEAAHTQDAWDLRFDWGAEGLRATGEGVAAVVIVDVLRFTSAVSVAVGRGGVVLPYRWGMGNAAATYAARHGAEVAARDRSGGWSLSPADMARLPAGTRLVLPSPNGAALAFGARDEVPGTAVIAGCLRNATAAGAVAGSHPGPVAVVAAGERWGGSLGPLRPSVEDLLGAGAVLRALVDVAGRSAGDASPEARAAIAAFDAARGDLATWLAGSASGRELLAAGYGDDVEVAAVTDAEDVAPVLADGLAFTGVTPAAAGPLR